MNLIKKSKYLSYLLRHHPEDANLDMDKEGWVSIEQLIKNTAGKFTIENLEKIVFSDNKNRYSISRDGLKIRANQGHSTDKCDITFKKETPPDILFHGTILSAAVSIIDEGIKKGNRQYVHLSGDKETAVRVGSRRGKVVILKVDSKRMFEDGVDLYLSDNGVWLTKYVDPKYIIQEPYLEEVKIVKIQHYNKAYGDDRLCECGHTYYRHFDSWDNMEPCGCKYCGCNLFREKK